MSVRPSVYLAGPDVFRADCIEYAHKARQLCDQYGFEPLCPLDNEPPLQCDAPAAARVLFLGNLDMIRRATAVVANLTPFRGIEPDSGTAFEVGYAHALGRPIVAYVPDARPLLQRLPLGAVRAGDTPGTWTMSADGSRIENFNLPLNLMLACAVQWVEGDLQDALNLLQRRLSVEIA